MTPLRKYIFPLTIMLLFLLSCSKAPVPPASQDAIQADNDLQSSLVGMWRTDALVVGIDTIHNSDMSVILEVRSDEWVERMKMQPIQTIFNPNKTYISAYTNAEGKVIKVTAGKWSAAKNQLKIHQLFPNDQQMNYRVDLTAGSAELRSKLDFDGDGKDDDFFYCQMKKVS
ncbi:MAG: hypothetical protein NT126_01710 [Bacteroidetes bacterium]|nr:hypothetical protein [Bacteroidota bacterium]